MRARWHDSGSATGLGPALCRERVMNVLAVLHEPNIHLNTLTRSLRALRLRALGFDRNHRILADDLCHGLQQELGSPASPLAGSDMCEQEAIRGSWHRY